MSDMKKLLEAMDTMAAAEKKPTGPKFPGYLKGTDPASKVRDKMVGSEQEESVIKELSETAKDTSTERKLKEEFANFQGVAEGLDGQRYSVVKNGKVTKSFDSVAKAKDYAAKFGGTIKDNNKQQGVAEGSNNVGDTVRALYQKIYDQGDDALEYLNTHAENFARYWDRFEGDLDSMIDELPPKILAKLSQELQQVAGQEGANDLPQDTLDLIDEYIAKVEPSANRNKLIQDVIDGYIHTSELEYALQDNLSEETLDEKSVSKAQFRTMAAAAHNPKFAKKVGISGKVAKEFHKADKKSSYKSLPAKVDEDGKPDTITMDVPLMIRLFEYAREDAQTDMDLHDVAERLIKLSQEDRTLTMQDYDTICPSQEQSVAEGSDVERKIHRTQALIQDYYNRSRNTSNDIKRDHYIDMARQLEYELEGMINDANRAEQDSYDVAQHDAEPSATWNRGGLAEGEVVKFPKKHKGDLENTHECPKCGGDLQGGKYMGHQVKVCMPCKQVYLPPNSGIDQQGNPIKPVDEEQESKYGDKYQSMVQRVGQKAKEQEKKKPVDIKALAAKLAAMNDKVKELKEVATVAPTTAAGAPSTTQQAQQGMVNTQKNLSKLKTVLPQLNPAMANQALQNIATNPQAPVAGAQMAQTKNLADLVGDALADPQKGPQVATMLSQVQQAQKLKK